MPTIIDMHCHVLPGVDDGPGTMEESIAILREAERQGLSAMIVTPHFHPGRYMVPAPKVRETIKQVRRALKEEGIRLKLYPGQECYYYSGLVRELDEGNVLTMGDTNYVLVEFDPSVLYSVIQHAMRELFSAGYRPIVAHYERYRCLNGREDRLEELRSHGAMLQMNFDRLLDKEGFFRRNPWRRQLREGFVDFLGSDTHGMGFRPLHAKQAVAWLTSEVDPELVHVILERNIRLLTEGDDE
ncbi:MAG: hypothetical protein IJ646_00650 [Clostridia bacterium]|nr:hypothetical protein [Clostridia bacterium]